VRKKTGKILWATPIPTVNILKLKEKFEDLK
jgi:hypothetical protein